ncbi:hypothetical protein ACFQW6_07205 [Nocardioides sp. GCM10028917]|uniref:hypothetical protein n=1 Tax=Nocardioides sp. GCM10028917 TaxID=3273408 RepID=UPI00361F5402
MVVTSALTQSPAGAHPQRGLAASILTNEVSCVEDIFCAIEGRVRVWNNRPAGTAPIVICVGVDVHTAEHQSLSFEPPLPGGQAVIRLRPGRNGVADYRTVFDDSGPAHHVHVTHVHRHVVHGFGGQQC